jgi:hypothetical protein
MEPIMHRRLRRRSGVAGIKTTTMPPMLFLVILNLTPGNASMKFFLVLMSSLDNHERDFLFLLKKRSLDQLVNFLCSYLKPGTLLGDAKLLCHA